MISIINEKMWELMYCLGYAFPGATSSFSFPLICILGCSRWYSQSSLSCHSQGGRCLCSGFQVFGLALPWSMQLFGEWLTGWKISLYPSLFLFFFQVRNEKNRRYCVSLWATVHQSLFELGSYARISAIATIRGGERGKKLSFKTVSVAMRSVGSDHQWVSFKSSVWFLFLLSFMCMLKTIPKLTNWMLYTYLCKI